MFVAPSRRSLASACTLPNRAAVLRNKVYFFFLTQYKPTDHKLARSARTTQLWYIIGHAEVPNGAPRFGLWVDAVRFARDQTSLLARTSANALRCVRPTSGYLISVAYIRVAWEWGREPNFRYSLRRSSNWVRWSGSLPLYKPYICKHCGPSSKTGPQCGSRAQARPSGAAVIGIHWTTLKKRVSVGGSRATRGREAHKDRSLRIANYVSHPPEGCSLATECSRPQVAAQPKIVSGCSKT